MSSQFSYELDERQIRLLLQDSELECDAGAWDRFESSQTQSKSTLNSFTPKINFAISRSVIVPVIFVILIGGLSAMLFSFVDFKKKDINNKETALIAKEKPILFKTLHKKTIINAIVGKKEEVIKPVDTHTVNQLGATEIKPIAKIVVPIVTKPVIEKVKEPVVEKIVNTTSKNTENKVSRKRKKVTSEEIPTINASTTGLNSENVEPELELK